MSMFHKIKEVCIKDDCKISVISNAFNFHAEKIVIQKKESVVRKKRKRDKSLKNFDIKKERIYFKDEEENNRPKKKRKKNARKIASTTTRKRRKKETKKRKKYRKRNKRKNFFL
ncbi:unnamed protein product [marine sediment metagenome]|uniref:Uncharacterized protein n=1 Tax=marine sediment metagenome TaxID=412755 RepID=X1GC83_9ZZZZ